MTSARFRALEDRVNSAVRRHLSSVLATVNGVQVEGFMEAGIEPATLDGYGPGPGPAPVMVVTSVQVPLHPEGLLLRVTSGPSAGAYRIANARHDGAGMCALELLHDKSA